MASTQHIVPCLWFDGQAEEAAQFYTGIFRSSRILGVHRYSEAGQEVHGRPAGSVMIVDFELDGQRFTALNGGPHFTFNEAVSLQIMCDTQADVDRYWSALTAGGDPAAQQCGWLKDKYGLSWQVVPKAVTQMMSDPDPAKAGRVMTAVLKMKKIDIEQARVAYAG